MEKYVRIFLMLVLSGMAGSSGYLLYNTARYIELEAYEPRFIEVYTERERPPVERAATSSHATTKLSAPNLEPVDAHRDDASNSKGAQNGLQVGLE